MTRGVYTVATGMIASQQAMDTVANNLANANTAGFKEDQLLFSETMERTMTSANGTTLGSIGAGSRVVGQFTDNRQGSVTTTSNPFDVAIEGDGMFAVQGPNGVAYTRDGSFTVTNGMLTTKNGLNVLDASMKPIEVQPGQIHISQDGAITGDTDLKPYAQLAVFNGNFTKTGGGLYSSPNATAQTTSTPSAAKITQGAVENSNVNAISAMTQMITLGRIFDMSQKSISSQDELTQKLTATLAS